MSGLAIVIGSMLDKRTPTWHRPVYRTGTHDGKRWQTAYTLCGIRVASVERKGRAKPKAFADRKFQEIRQDHAEQIGRECSRCAARHKEALDG